MFDKIREYIKDDEFRFTVFENRIHIINYSEILSLETERISFRMEEKRFVIKGNNLVLNRLLENEVLIMGTVFSIEVFYD